MQGLQHLETLKIDAKLSEVPPDIVQLPRLLHLNLPGNAILPDGFGRMSSIQELGCFDLSNNSEDNVLNLGSLTNLQDLYLSCSTMPADNLEKKLQCFGSTLAKLQSLKSLTMSPDAFFHENTLKASALSNIISLDDLSIVSSPPSLLQKLELPRICTFSILPKWIGKLGQLSILKIQVVSLSGDHVDILKGLPALAALSLFIRTATAQRIVLGKDAFPVLKYFKFICPELCIAFMKGAMPNVRRLKLSFDADTIVRYNPVISGLEHLTGLEYISAKIGSPGADESSRMAARSTLEAGFSPRRVNIKWVNWRFFDERSTDLQMQKRQEMENRNPIPDVNIKGYPDDQYGIGGKGSWKNRNKQADSRIILSSKSSDQHVQQTGSWDDTSEQDNTGRCIPICRRLPSMSVLGQLAVEAYLVSGVPAGDMAGDPSRPPHASRYHVRRTGIMASSTRMGEAGARTSPHLQIRTGHQRCLPSVKQLRGNGEVADSAELHSLIHPDAKHVL